MTRHRINPGDIVIAETITGPAKVRVHRIAGPDNRDLPYHARIYGQRLDGEGAGSWPVSEVKLCS